MPIILVALIIVLILAGAGFALHVLWWIAIVCLILWLLGFVFRSRGATRGRWYRW